MKQLAHLLLGLTAIACGSVDASPRSAEPNLAGAGGVDRNLGTSGSSADPGSGSWTNAGSGAISGSTNAGTAGGGGTSALPTAGTAGGGGGEVSSTAGTAGRGAQCDSQVLPATAPVIDLTFPTGTGAAYGSPSLTQGINGYVYAERVEKGLLNLTDEAGHRCTIAAKATGVAFEKIPLGTRFWLMAESVESRSNPFAYHRSLRFNLRTEENGPVLLAAAQGLVESGDGLLGIPIEVAPSCTSLSETGTQRSSANPCLVSTEFFELRLGTNPSQVLTQGTMSAVTIGGVDYDMALRSASRVSYPEYDCAPADFASDLSFSFMAVARSWQERVAVLPVYANRLPACRMGLGSPTQVFDVNSLRWDAIPDGAVESTMSLVSSTNDSVEFALPDLGRLSVSGLTDEGRKVVERGSWFSMFDYYNYAIRDKEGGRVIAASVAGSYSAVSAALARPDLLDLSIAIEPRCEWLSGACTKGSATGSLSQFDVIYGGDISHQVASQERTVVDGSEGKYDAWISVTPSCTANPHVDATFLVTE